MESEPKRRRLAHDVLGKLLDRLKESPRDISAWRSLFDELTQKDKSDELRDAYERFLKLLPRSAQIWTEYIDLELRHAEFARAEKLFGRCLRQVPDVALYQCYIGYIRRCNTSQDSHKTISQAYEFAISRVMHDPRSGPLFKDYIDFLNSRKTESSWDQQHKMDEVRKAYRRAVALPLFMVEQLWREYTSFEQNVSRVTARKFIEERSPAYMAARSASKELANLYQQLTLTSVPSERQYFHSEQAQFQRWKHLVQWEQANPLTLDQSIVTERTLFVLRQAAFALAYFPEWFFYACEFCMEAGMTEEASEMLVAGLETNPASFVLAARLSELHESRERRDDALAVLRKHISSLSAIVPEGPNRRLTLSYAELMRTTKRLLGVKEARKVSSECRKLPSATFHIYTASAALEAQDGEQVVASKIYEIAYRKFASEPDFIRLYLEFLFKRGDSTNAKVVFEKALLDFDPSQLRILYDLYLEHEAAHSDATTLAELEKRYTRMFPETNPVELYARRFRQHGGDPVGDELHWNSEVVLALPASVTTMLDALPQEVDYDGPVINLERLVEMLGEVA